jgi:hypothetical protein
MDDLPNLQSQTQVRVCSVYKKTCIFLQEVKDNSYPWYAIPFE